MNNNFFTGSAIISSCKTYRYRLDRYVQNEGVVIAYFGVNGSTATADQDDQTTKKWFGFTLRNGGSKYIIANPFALRSTDVRRIASVVDPVGPDNTYHLHKVIEEADILVPCWGNRSKVPKHLWSHFDNLLNLLFASGKPIKTLGFTKRGDPRHPLMLGYDTPFQDWYPHAMDKAIKK